MFAEAEDFRGRMVPRYANLKEALERYQRLLLLHPESDKVDDAAYWIGHIYESRYLTHHQKAIDHYRRCVTWNPDTTTDARYRIAYILDYSLHDPAAAMEAYREVLEHAPAGELRDTAERRLQALERQHADAAGGE